MIQYISPLGTQFTKGEFLCSKTMFAYRKDAFFFESFHDSKGGNSKTIINIRR